MPLKPMKKLLFYSLFSFFFSISFSQEIAIYNFANKCSSSTSKRSKPNSKLVSNKWYWHSLN